jgi:hypothetical protein
MELSEDGMCDIISPELQRVLERKVAECDRQLAEIAAFRNSLASAAARLALCAEDATVVACTNCSAFESQCGCLPPTVEITLSGRA